jgi:peptidoglycan hydrolase-like protein with peptidoglycan-binding domain
MASRVISILAALSLVGVMVAPALAQTSGSGTGSAPATGSGSTPSKPPAPSATQPGTTTPSPGTGSGSTGKAKPGGSMGQTGASAPSSGGSMSGGSKSGTSMNGGAGSEQVKSVQKALQDKGMDPGPVDGIMGPKTMAALKAFQKDQKLPESGRLDDQTRDKLGVTR